MNTAKDVLEYSIWLVQRDSDRVTTQLEIRKVYNLLWDWEVADKNPWMIRVVDPLPNNAIRTMANILANKEPRIRVKIPKEAMVATEIDRSNPLIQAAYQMLPAPIKAFWNPREPIHKTQESYENILRYCFRQNDERRDGALRKDVALDGLLYDQIVMKCIDLRMSNAWDSERQAGKSPFVIKRLDPTAVYVERDDFGVSCVLHRYVRSLREVIGVFGESKLKTTYKLDDIKDNRGAVLFCEMYWRDGETIKQAMWIEKREQAYTDLDAHLEETAWVANEEGVEIIENPSGFIPIISKTCNGTGGDIMPILYAAEKSNFHAASNAAYTLLISNAIKFGIGQYQKAGANPNDPPMVIDWTQPHIYPTGAGQEIKTIDPPESDKQVEALKVIIGKMQESTAPESITGKYPPGTPASAFALSLSAGTKVIDPIRDGLDQAFSQIGMMMLDYARVYPEFDKEVPSLELWIDNGKTVIEPNKIPRWMDVSVQFEPQLPSDENAKMQIAMQAYQTAWLPRKKTYELAKFDDINEIEDLWKEQGEMQGAPPPERTRVGQQLLNTASAPGVAPQAEPVNQNPQPPQPGQMAQRALMGRMK